MRDVGVALVLSVLVAVAAGCGQEPIPANPTFEVDVKPIFAANCVRCHGAGGTLNKDPRAITPADVPSAVYLDIYADQGDCTLDANGNTPASCKRGAKEYVSLIKAYVHGVGMKMPLPPSEPLSDWELGVIDRWIANGAPDAPP